MRVITLNNESLDNKIKELADMIASDFNPDLVIAIANGGCRIGATLSQRFGCQCLNVKLQRPTTRFKSRIIPAILPKLPLFLKNFLRIAESVVLAHRHVDHDCVSKISFDTRFAIQTGLCVNNILVVDDAVDSGHTLRCITDAVCSEYPQAIVKSAVLTVTTKSPVISPDYYLFNNRTLIRFPWSSDA